MKRTKSAAAQVLVMGTMFLLASLAIAAQSSSAVQAIGKAERSALFPTRAMIDFGQAVVEANCANCHGMDGSSKTEGEPRLAGQRTVYLYRVQKAFQSGERADTGKNHSSFLNDKAMLSAAVYYANLTPAQTVNAPVPTQVPGVAEQAVAMEEDPFLSIRSSMKKCSKCHGETGSGSKPGSPGLTAQDPAYFVASMQAYVDGSRSHKLMKKLVGRLDEATIRDMGVFYGVQDPQPTQTQGVGDANVGRRLAEDCATCHGADGNAKKSKIPTLAGQDAKYFVKVMNYYKNGKRLHEKMAEAVEQLSEQDIIDLATYYAAGQARKRDVRMPLKSNEWIVRCERCHGIDGNSSDPRFPMLAGQDETYLRKSLEAYASGQRENTTMHAMADLLSPINIERIGAFFANQRPKAVVYMQLPDEDQQPE